MSGFIVVGGRSNWQVTHNQPPYLAPAKPGCIRWLVIGLDLANVFHSRTSRQLAVIRAWPELPLAAAPPPLCSPLLSVPTLTVGQVRRKLEALLTRPVRPPLLLLCSVLKLLQQFRATRRLVCGQRAWKTTSGCNRTDGAKRENVILVFGGWSMRSSTEVN